METSKLGRREREIMEAVYRRGEASVTEVRGDLANPPSYSAVRAMLGILESKGYLQHKQDGLKYVYRATADPRTARTSALRHMVHTFFGGSPETAVAALLELPDTRMPARDRQRLLKMVQAAKQEER
jgi:predicted transcriptional regulator